jgi:hypothetical protein
LSTIWHAFGSCLGVDSGPHAWYTLGISSFRRFAGLYLRGGPMSYKMHLRREAAKIAPERAKIHADLLALENLCAGGQYHLTCPRCSSPHLRVRVSSQTFEHQASRGEPRRWVMDYFAECPSCWLRCSERTDALYAVPWLSPPVFPDVNRAPDNRFAAAVVAKLWDQFTEAALHRSMADGDVYCRRLSPKQAEWLQAEWNAEKFGKEPRGPVKLPGDERAEWALTASKVDGAPLLWVRGQGLQFVER